MGNSDKIFSKYFRKPLLIVNFSRILQLEERKLKTESNLEQIKTRKILSI